MVTGGDQSHPLQYALGFTPGGSPVKRSPQKTKKSVTIAKKVYVDKDGLIIKDSMAQKILSSRRNDDSHSLANNIDTPKFLT